MLSGDTKVNKGGGGQQCVKQKKYTVNTSYHYQIAIHYSKSLLSSVSSLGLLHPKSMIILLMSLMFLNKKTDFLLIKFFNVTFRLPSVSANTKFLISRFSFI